MKLKKAHVITDKKKIQQLAKMTNGIIGLETLKIELYEKGEVVIKEPLWFKDFRIQNDRRWEENNKRWEENSRRWEKILKLPTIKKEITEM